MKSKSKIQLHCCILSVSAGLLVLLAANRVNALDPRFDPDAYIKSAWDMEAGLPQASIQAMAQTRDGYIWICTQSGLVRFDGDEFEIFDKENTQALQSNYVSTITQGRDGTVWVGMETGIAILDSDQTRFWGAEQGFDSRNVTSLVEDNEGRMWVASSSSNLYYIESDHLESLSVDDERKDLTVNRALVDTEGRLWVATNVGVYRKESAGFKRFSTKDGLPSDHVEVIYQGNDGELWVGTGMGPARWNGSSFTVPPGLERLSQGIVSGILKDKDGTMWFSTFDQGTLIYRNAKLMAFENKQLGSGRHSALMEDFEGSVWIGTGAFGAVQLRDPKLTIHRVNPASKSNVAWAVLGDSRGDLWVGTASSVGRFVGGKVDLYDASRGLDGSTFMALFEDLNGDILIGTHGAGILRARGGRLSSLAAQFPEVRDKGIRAILRDSQNRMWIGARNAGVYIYENGKLQQHFHSGNELKSGQVTFLRELATGEILIGTDIGVVGYLHGRLRHWSDVKGLPKYRAFDAYVDREGNLWYGTVENGIYLLRTNGAIFNFTKKHGLFDNSAWSILEDDSDHFWISSNHGIYRVSRGKLLAVAEGKAEKVQTDSFGRPEGLATPECNSGGQFPGTKTLEGHLVFTCVDGAVAIDPREITRNEVIPPVLIEKASIGETVLKNGMMIPHTDRRVAFEFTALTYVSPKDATIQYKLEGFDKEWQSVSKERAAFYMNLPPRGYTFRVKAANSDGVWNEEGASLSFVVEKPFYLKVWFYLLVLLFLGAIVGVVIWFSNRRTQKQTTAMSELAWQRTRKVLEGQVDAIRELIGDSSTVSNDIQTLMDQLATSSEQVAAAVSETATTVQELERTGKTSEKNVKRIVDAAKKTEDQSVKGREAVDQSVRMMADIQKDSLSIEQESKNLLGRVAEVDAITTLVGEISEQSAVLSINASIEASKAGEFGDGFGVVAENMQELANRSKDATMQISEVLSNINIAIEKITGIAVQGRERMDKGVASIQRSGTIVRSLSDEVAENSYLAQTIAQSIEQQITGLNYIAKAVTEFTSTVDENKIISRNLAVGSNKLGKSIKNLLETIEGWKTPEFYQ